MSLLTGIAIFIIFWFLSLFITLPFGMRSQLDGDDEIVLGTDPGAPIHPNLPKRLFWNTVLSLTIFFLYWFIVFYVGFGIDDLPTIF